MNRTVCQPKLERVLKEFWEIEAEYYGCSLVSVRNKEGQGEFCNDADGNRRYDG